MRASTDSPFAAAIAMNRFGLGARPSQRTPADPAGWLLDQLGRHDPAPATLADAPRTADLAARLAAYLQALRSGQEAASPSQMAAFRQMAREGYGSSVAARVAAAVATDTPFPERLVHFWANHFAVSADKVQTIGLAGPHEFEAIRPNILGSFEQLLLASTRHAAMLLYLDQAQSIGPDSPLGLAAADRAARRPTVGARRVGLNENLAREILELHTLGVDGGYTQADVTELARALTGWSTGGFVRRPIGIEAPAGQFVFQPAWHQPGPRTLLGRRYAQQGEAQAEAMLKDLARHPATARHVAIKLARHFVADDPPPTLVARLEADFRASGGNLPSLYRTLVAAPEAWAQPLAKFRSPWDWAIACLRAVDARDLAPQRGVGLLNELGQPAWRPGSPAGWGDRAADWAAPDALVRRVEAAARLALLAPAGLDARGLAQRLLPGTLSQSTAQAIDRAEDGRQALALLFVAPEQLRR